VHLSGIKAEARTVYRKGRSIVVDITDVAEAGQCVGYGPSGVCVLVRGPAAVGDRVEARIYKIKKDRLEARLLAVRTPTPQRVEPYCGHFGLCGGCQWQHVTYIEQCRIKRKLVRDALESTGRFRDIPILPVTPAPSSLAYRNKVDFSFTDRRYLLPEELDIGSIKAQKPETFALGFHAPHCYSKAIDIDYCHLASAETNTVLDVVRQFCLRHKPSIYSTRTHQGLLRNLVVRHALSTKELMVNLVTSWHDRDCMMRLTEALREALREQLTTLVNNVTRRKSIVALGDEEFVYFGDGAITEQLGPFQFKISANSFFQTNTEQARALYEKTVELAQIQPRDVVYDLYCGAGSISMFLARSSSKVLGLEMNASAIKDAETNTALNGVSNCSFRQLDLRDLEKMHQELQAFDLPDVIVTDPPRAGMHPKALKTMADLAPSRIVYLSCKPASLARDAAAICERGSYRLQEVHPVDMFPQTHHVESIAVFVRMAE
jgi:23S rRNA (uracil1939-C5)-methyltransferase